MAFWLRMFGAFAYAMVVQYYYGYGDAFTFYVGGNFIIDQIQSNFSNISLFFASPEELQKLYAFQNGTVGGVNGYIGIKSAVAVMKTSAFISVFTFNKFLISSLLLAFFSFAGQWRLFMVFNDINKGKNQKLLAWAVLYTPSIWFWGSGLIKESICLGALGFIIGMMYSMFIKGNFSVKNIILTAALVYLVWIIKSYIIIILSIGLATFIFYKFLTPFKNIVIRAFIIIIFLSTVLFIAFITNFAEQLQELANESKVQVDSYQRNYDAAKNEDDGTRGNIESNEIDASIGGLILHSPIAIFTCLFRPFLWESRKVFILFSSLESTLVLFCTIFLLYKMKFLGFIAGIFKSPFILTSFLIAILFAIIIGFTTYNFGSMARYKIVLLPFYFFTLISLHTIQQDQKNNIV